MFVLMHKKIICFAWVLFWSYRLHCQTIVFPQHSTNLADLCVLFWFQMRLNCKKLVMLDHSTIIVTKFDKFTCFRFSVMPQYGCLVEPIKDEWRTNWATTKTFTFASIKIGLVFKISIFQIWLGIRLDFQNDL